LGLISGSRARLCPAVDAAAVSLLFGPPVELLAAAMVRAWLSNCLGTPESCGGEASRVCELYPYFTVHVTTGFVVRRNRWLRYVG
jgi:hypothetical protein